MVEYSASLDVVFQALSHPVRREMLQALEAGEQSVVALAEPFEMSLAAAAKHVQILERAGLITRRKDGRTQYCRLRADAFRAAHNWLVRYASIWDARLEKLNELLRADRENDGEQQDD